MSRFPSVRIKPAPASAKAALNTWLAEWRIDRVLTAGDATAGVEPQPGMAQAADGALPEPLKRGQIRLLRPLSRATRERPRYVAVLEGFPDGAFLIAPFSRFSVPATPGELATGESALPVRVVCLWNTRRASASLASTSWSVGVLGASVLEDVATLQRHLADGSPPAESLAARTGPRLRHPLDPRMEYLDEERLWMNEAVDAGGAAVKPALRYVRPELKDLPMAAEEKGKYTVDPEATGQPEEPRKEGPDENPPDED